MSRAAERGQSTSPSGTQAETLHWPASLAHYRLAFPVPFLHVFAHGIALSGRSKQAGDAKPLMRSIRVRTLVGAMVLGCLVSVPLRAEEPWSARVEAPVMVAGAHQPLPAAVTTVPQVPDGFGGQSCHLWLRFYQRWFSRFMTTRCPMKPSCSRYSQEAVSRYGVGWGILMTADRLYHERSEQAMARLVPDPDRIRFPDPVESNVIWRNPHGRD